MQGFAEILGTQTNVHTSAFVEKIETNWLHLASSVETLQTSLQTEIGVNFIRRRSSRFGIRLQWNGPRWATVLHRNESISTLTGEI